jgi:hypothetical protein
VDEDHDLLLLEDVVTEKSSSLTEDDGLEV